MKSHFGERTARFIRWLLVAGLLTLSLELLPAAPVNAQTTYSVETGVSPQFEATIEPAQITVVGMRRQVEKRHIFFRNTSPIDNFQLMSMDLNRSDRTAVLPAEAITLENPLVSQTHPNELTALLKFDLRKVPSSGEFNGKLRLSFQNGEQFIPVTVRVKDPWFLPLIVLFTGTALSVCVSIYRAQGRPRDEILIRVSQLRAQMRENGDLEKAASFQSRVETQLLDVKMALDGERWEDARNAVQQAELVWNKWLKGRSDWLAQLAYRHEIYERYQGLKGQGFNLSTPYLQAVGRSLEEAVREAPDLESPMKLRDRLEELADQLNRYLKIKTKLSELKDLCGQLSAEAKQRQYRLHSLEQEIENLPSSDRTKYDSIIAELEKEIAEVTALLSQQEEETSSFSFSITAKTQVPGLTLLAPPPSASSGSWEERASGANVRLKIFTLASYGLAIVFLAGSGFSQLYVDNPTFGATPWNDYFALLVWGFGAEATRDSVTKVVQGWGLPG